MPLRCSGQISLSTKIIKFASLEIFILRISVREHRFLRSVKSRLRTRSERNFRTNLDPVSINVKFGEEPAFPRERPISIRSRVEQLEENFKSFKRQRMSAKSLDSRQHKRGIFSRLSQRTFARASCKSNWGNMEDFEMEEIGETGVFPNTSNGLPWNVLKKKIKDFFSDKKDLQIDVG